MPLSQSSVLLLRHRRVGGSVPGPGPAVARPRPRQAVPLLALLLLSSLEAGHLGGKYQLAISHSGGMELYLGVQVPLPDLLLQTDDQVHRQVHDAQLGLRFV